VISITVIERGGSTAVTDSSADSLR